jgi:hypothetical protein
MVGCEGFMGGGLSKHLVGLSGEEYEAWVNVILDAAEDPNVLSSSDHILVVAEMHYRTVDAQCSTHQLLHRLGKHRIAVTQMSCQMSREVPMKYPMLLHRSVRILGS